MVNHTCESCNYSTPYYWMYTRHVNTKKHLFMQNTENANKMQHICKICSKKYKCNSGLWRHTQTCKKNTETVNSHKSSLENIVINNALLETMTNINANINAKFETLESKMESNMGTVNNINNNNNTVNINIYMNYLDANCSKAMNLTEFLEKLEFTKEDFKKIQKKRFYVQGANSILKQKLESLPIEERPMHCSQPIVDTPASFFIRENNTWITECLAVIEYSLKYRGDIDEETKKMMTERFIQEFNSKCYDSYTKIVKTEPTLKKDIDDKMYVCGQSTTHINMVHELPDLLALDTGSNSPMALLPPNPNNNTDIV